MTDTAVPDKAPLIWNFPTDRFSIRGLNRQNFHFPLSQFWFYFVSKRPNFFTISAIFQEWTLRGWSGGSLRHWQVFSSTPGRARCRKSVFQCPKTVSTNFAQPWKPGKRFQVVHLINLYCLLYIKWQVSKRLSKKKSCLYWWITCIGRIQTIYLKLYWTFG